MSVTIRLSPYKKDFVLSTKYIQQYLPKSLFAEALEQEPDVKVIPIDNPLVTPEVMQILVRLCNKGYEPTEPCPTALLAADYLNIPGLIPYADPCYGSIIVGFQRDLIYFEYRQRRYIYSPWDETKQRKILTRILREDRIWLFRYLVQRGLPLENWYLAEAVTGQAHQIFEVLLANKQMDPSFKENTCLTEACKQGDLKIVKALLTDERVLATSIGYPLRCAIEGGHLEIVRLLLALCKPDRHRNTLLCRAAESGRIEMCQLVIEDMVKRPSRGVDTFLRESVEAAAEHGHVEVVKFLLAHPEIGPHSRFAPTASLLRKCAEKGHQETVALLLTMPFSDYDRPSTEMLVSLRNFAAPMPKCTGDSLLLSDLQIS